MSIGNERLRSNVLIKGVVSVPRHLLVVSLCCLPALVSAQDFMVLEKMGTKKRFEYWVGDRIKFKLKADEFFQSDVITGLSDSAVMFDNGMVKMTEFERIGLITKRGWMIGIGTSLITAGVGFVTIDQVNKIIRGEGLSYDGRVMRTSAILSGLGIAMVGVANRRVRVKRNWRLRMVDMTPD